MPSLTLLQVNWVESGEIGSGNYSGYIYLGAKIGEPNGLRLLLDAEVYDHGPGHAISQVQLKLTFSDVI